MAIKKRELSGTPQQEPRSYETEHAQLARRAAAEGIVLLKTKMGCSRWQRGANWHCLAPVQVVRSKVVLEAAM
ncbi:hypothetical protein H6B10_14705 [Gemmiger formicilis]|uniref:hypothetical protein n=1 Tax=Gemmiger formicilis TaxID=745368 RepID=UPI00195B51FA|nr:hypothetical protein [Gemmiger formicilis]MBM6900945.1 hypothetical protein [Gemmiger formicilis]